ncbi:MAG: type II toxin-antitoxin system VapC family toxin [Archaeoglobaceae archaeon]
MNEVFIDSSIIVAHCMVGNKSFERLLELYKLCTSPNVIEEAFYKCLYLKTESIEGKGEKYLLRDDYIRKKKHYEEIVDYFNVLIRELVEAESLKVLPITDKIVLHSIEVSWEYSLLPNDALIAATCKHYGIRKIATFDEDFKRVDFLEVLEL